MDEASTNAAGHPRQTPRARPQGRLRRVRPTEFRLLVGGARRPKPSEYTAPRGRHAYTRRQHGKPGAACRASRRESNAELGQR
ncbi:MAG: hypothetical protein ACLUQ6_03910 [Alistipes onderdonkii]